MIKDYLLIKVVHIGCLHTQHLLMNLFLYKTTLLWCIKHLQAEKLWNSICLTALQSEHWTSTVTRHSFPHFPVSTVRLVNVGVHTLYIQLPKTYCTVLYCIVKYCIVLYRNVLYCIVLIINDEQTIEDTITEGSLYKPLKQNIPVFDVKASVAREINDSPSSWLLTYTNMPTMCSAYSKSCSQLNALALCVEHMLPFYLSTCTLYEN